MFYVLYFRVSNFYPCVVEKMIALSRVLHFGVEREYIREGVLFQDVVSKDRSQHWKMKEMPQTTRQSQKVYGIQTVV